MSEELTITPSKLKLYLPEIVILALTYAVVHLAVLYTKEHEKYNDLQEVRLKEREQDKVFWRDAYFKSKPLIRPYADPNSTSHDTINVP